MYFQTRLFNNFWKSFLAFYVPNTTHANGHVLTRECKRIVGRDGAQPAGDWPDLSGENLSYEDTDDGAEAEGVGGVDAHHGRQGEVVQDGEGDGGNVYKVERELFIIM